MNSRTHSLGDWAEKALARKLEIGLISGDASFRKYYRVSDSTNTWVLMDAPPEKESVAQFRRVAAVLEGAGVNAPAISHSDDERGFALMSDFGDRTYLDAAGDGAAEELYSDAIAALVAIQSLGKDAPLPPYSKRMLLNEMRLYPDWYVGRNLGAKMSARDRSALADAFELIADRAIAQPQVPVHRDYHSRNLMVTAPNPGILDFQDAVIGPHSYDLLSLLKDAYVRWPEDRIDRWIGEFLELSRESRARPPPSPDEFREDFDWIGVQRFLKVVGIFSRLSIRDGKDGYLGDLPRVEDYLVETAERLPELGALRRIVSGNRERRLAR